MKGPSEESMLYLQYTIGSIPFGSAFGFFVAFPC